uniref:Uncharacterized protein n=1 Tax=Octopus bimaculoides TaxID=37653 RepID=A0A0L8FN67_OCTBM
MNLFDLHKRQEKKKRKTNPWNSSINIRPNYAPLFILYLENPPTDDTQNRTPSTFILAIKNRIVHIRNEKLKVRKFSFWNMIKNNHKAEIYERWLNSTPIILPHKFQIKRIPNEQDQRRQLRENLTLEKMKTEIELLKLRALSNEEKLKNIDEEIYNELKKH